MIPFVDLRAQYLSIKDEIDEAVERVMSSGNYILGPEVEEFEKEFKRYCGMRYGVACGSGTDAIRLALEAMNVKDPNWDFSCLTVANTAVPTVTAIKAAGVKPAYTDFSEVTMLMKLTQERVEDTSANSVVPVHLYGGCCDMKGIIKLARDNEAVVIEDCAQAHGAKYGGKRVPVGGCGAFSFYPTKNLGGMGDSGMVVCNDKQVANRMRILRNLGQKRKYYHSTPGINSRMDDLQAAILRAKLPHLDKWNEARSKLAEQYTQELGDCVEIQFSNEHLEESMKFPAAHGSHVYHLYVIRSKHRDKIQAALKDTAQTMIHYPRPVFSQPAYHGTGSGMPPRIRQRYLQMSKEILSLPMYPELSSESVDTICKVIKKTPLK